MKKKIGSEKIDNMSPEHDIHDKKGARSQQKVEQYTVFIPLEGIEFQTNALEFGEIILATNNIGQLNTLLKTPEIMGTYQHVETGIPDYGCHLVIKLEGDFSVIKEQSFIKAQEVISILNLYLGSCRFRRNNYGRTDPPNAPSPEYKKEKIGLWGMSSVRSQIYYSLQTETDPYYRSDIRLDYLTYQESFSRIAELNDGDDGLLQDLRAKFGLNTNRNWLHQIDNEKIAQWKQDGFDAVVKSFFQSNSKIDQRIKRAVTWFSKGVNAETTSEQFTALAIALESLLVGGGEGKNPWETSGSISQKLADRVAFLIGVSLETRLTLAQDTKELYGIRSNVVHEGEDVSPEKLYSMEDIVRKTIIAFVKQQFSSWEKFPEWIKKQIYTTGCKE
ncbi:MAG TPA: HEPN domain-containing protein [Anaerolineales bacterium]|nr:HEPN domain-containing protein [Anaerolineales bacterium]